MGFGCIVNLSTRVATSVSLNINDLNFVTFNACTYQSHENVLPFAAGHPKAIRMHYRCSFNMLYYNAKTKVSTQII